MPVLPPAALEAIARPSLQVTGLHDMGRPRNGDAGALPATVELRDGVSAAASAAIWTKQHEDEFLRNLAHKLRNPLAPIVTCVQILQSRAPQDRLLHHALDLMARQLTRLVHMLDDLPGANEHGGCDPLLETQPIRSDSANAGDGKADGLDGHRGGGRGLGDALEETDDKMNLQPTFNLRHRVLIVDDNLDAAEALRLLLCIKGFEVFTAGDGLEAIQRTKEYAPDVIFMDLEMPTMDGCEAARRIHAMPDYESIPIVALTGLDHDSDRERSRESGMVEHLVKPVAVRVVQEVLRSLIPGVSAYRS
jgi:CheY-like chemotaxis protein